MIDKYEDYPNGISADDINSANTDRLARIMEIYTSEFIVVINEVVNYSDDLQNKLNKYNTYSDIVSKQLNIISEENAIQVALLLGSMLEGALQFFLYAFECDYISSRWKKWDITDEQFDVITKKIGECFDNLETESNLTKRQKSSLLEVIRKELDIRKNGKNIDRIMLDELIGLCSNQRIFDTKTEIGKSDIDAMNRIRDARNNIHVFSCCSIPSMEEVIDTVKQFCFIMKDLLFRIRCISEDRKKEAIKENVLDIQGVTLVDVDDNYNVLAMHRRKEG